LQNEFLKKLKDHIKQVQTKAKAKKYTREVKILALMLSKKIEKIRQAQLGDRRFYFGDEKPDDVISITPIKVKKEKGHSARESLNFLLAGNTVEEVARIRGLAKATIDGHLADFVTTGEVELERIVSPQKVQAIERVLESGIGDGLAPIKQKLGDQYSYGEIKAVLNFRTRSQIKNE
jgi:hypothetical protein